MQSRAASSVPLLFWKAFFRGKLQRHTHLPGIILNPFTLEKGVTPRWISLL